MATTFDFTQGQGLFKRLYADRVVDMTPEHIYIMKEAKAVPPGPGESYQQAVVLANEQGDTFEEPDTAGAFAIFQPEAGVVKQAAAKGYQYLLRSTLSYEAIYRSQKNEQAFIQATKHVVKNMIRTSYNMQEACALWGQFHKGIINAVPTATTTTITDATFASGLWFGMVGRTYSIYSTAFGALRGTAKVTAVNIRTRTITWDALPAGTIAGDYLDFRGGPTKQMVGLYDIMTTTGTLFGINNTNYELWRSDAAYGAGAAPLTFGKVLEAIAEAGELGLGDEIGEIDILVGPRTWNSLNTDAAALKRNDASYKGSKFENGHEVLELFSNVGIIRIIAHRMMMNGYAMIMPKCSKSMGIVGSQPSPTFAVPGMSKDGAEYLKPMENNAGVETRLYWNAQIFTEEVPHLKLISGIVNPA